MNRTMLLANLALGKYNEFLAVFAKDGLVHRQEKTSILVLVDYSSTLSS
ncbi:hypothetical protein [Flavobacterium daemonense]|nr:hypothetical protein [Flavobacterium daemonense]KAF2329070.1 hypothetical protein FND99_17220 [Flavobacterium daemonense]